MQKFSPENRDIEKTAPHSLTIRIENNIQILNYLKLLDLNKNNNIHHYIAMTSKFHKAFLKFRNVTIGCKACNTCVTIES